MGLLDLLDPFDKEVHGGTVHGSIAPPLRDEVLDSLAVLTKARDNVDHGRSVADESAALIVLQFAHALTLTPWQRSVKGMSNEDKVKELLLAAFPICQVIEGALESRGCGVGDAAFASLLVGAQLMHDDVSKEVFMGTCELAWRAVAAIKKEQIEAAGG